MSTFKDLLAADRAVFLNIDEFGETHEVEGNEIPAIVDEEILSESKNGEDLGLAAADFILNAKVEDLPPKRPAGETLNVDGKECTIIKWRVDYGMAVIYLAHQISG